MKRIPRTDGGDGQSKTCYIESLVLKKKRAEGVIVIEEFPHIRIKLWVGDQKKEQR